MLNVMQKVTLLGTPNITMTISKCVLVYNRHWISIQQLLNAWLSAHIQQGALPLSPFHYDIVLLVTYRAYKSWSE